MTTMLERSAQLTAAAMVAKKYAEGDVGAYIALNGPAQYQADVEHLTAEILALEAKFREPLNDLKESIGGGDAVLRTVRTKPRNGPATPKAVGARNAVSQEELLTFLGNTTKELKEVVDRFSVSPGIANRALKKAIKDGKVESKAGVAVPGKKGKPAALFFVK